MSGNENEKAQEHREQMVKVNRNRAGFTGAYEGILYQSSSLMG